MVSKNDMKRKLKMQNGQKKMDQHVVIKTIHAQKILA